MTRILKQKVQLKSKPWRMIWRNTTYLIKGIQEIWVYRGRWWQGEPERIFYLVELKDGTLCEICREYPGDDWFLYRLYD